MSFYNQEIKRIMHKEIKKIVERFESCGYTMGRFGSSAAIHEQMLNDIKTLIHICDYEKILNDFKEYWNTNNDVGNEKITTSDIELFVNIMDGETCYTCVNFEYAPFGNKCMGCNINSNYKPKTK